MAYTGAYWAGVGNSFIANPDGPLFAGKPSSKSQLQNSGIFKLLGRKHFIDRRIGITTVFQELLFQSRN
jgi:hypothetical protein